eukprot:CAMPEP_0175077604 /NCGR_PEP_ID=MMETSP0052_2-20121109/23501_1 /TAXON_ID=51329 ORGANISM="Polytomella parva, Strain SAG 63-3" /NCGR_SAMPLE_ID=MMETSP0052_2 /ASSEMBLY_ACC=CAM_ASM_000194 /LENGTH=596 /DNA_ID=CAMNT_0016347125 /DNA_START=281 /DNA_END=2071 /DNA_ORIENTATION=+
MVEWFKELREAGCLDSTSNIPVSTLKTATGGRVVALVLDLSTIAIDLSLETSQEFSSGAMLLNWPSMTIADEMLGRARLMAAIGQAKLCCRNFLSACREEADLQARQERFYSGLQGQYYELLSQISQASSQLGVDARDLIDLSHLAPSSSSDASSSSAFSSPLSAIDNYLSCFTRHRDLSSYPSATSGNDPKDPLPNRSAADPSGLSHPLSHPLSHVNSWNVDPRIVAAAMALESQISDMRAHIQSANSPEFGELVRDFETNSGSKFRTDTAWMATEGDDDGDDEGGEKNKGKGKGKAGLVDGERRQGSVHPIIGKYEGPKDEDEDGEDVNMSSPSASHRHASDLDVDLDLNNNSSSSISNTAPVTHPYAIDGMILNAERMNRLFFEQENNKSGNRYDANSGIKANGSSDNNYNNNYSNSCSSRSANVGNASTTTGISSSGTVMNSHNNDHNNNNNKKDQGVSHPVDLDPFDIPAALRAVSKNLPDVARLLNEVVGLNSVDENRNKQSNNNSSNSNNNNGTKLGSQTSRVVSVITPPSDPLGHAAHVADQLSNHREVARQISAIAVQLRGEAPSWETAAKELQEKAHSAVMYDKHE